MGLRISLIVVGLVVGGCTSALPSDAPPSSAWTPVASMPPASPRESPGVSPSPSGQGSLSELYWYESLAMHDLEGMEHRSLLYGSLDGKFGGELPIGSISMVQRDGGAQPFEWIDPQVSGVFDGHALLWGRDGALGRIEAIDLETGTLEELIETSDVIHVATADAMLTTVYYVSVDAESYQPTGLWMLEVGGSGQPTRLATTLDDQPVHNFSRYRLAASADGAWVALQREETPPIVLDRNGGEAMEVDLGGPLVGFTERYLVGFGTQNGDGTYPVVAVDLASFQSILLTRTAVSAQVAKGQADAVATMQVRDNQFTIASIALPRPESTAVYSGDAGVNPLLARLDRSSIGYEVPPGTVLLVESFSRFIGKPPAERQLPIDAYPVLLDLDTGEYAHVGPFLRP